MILFILLAPIVLLLLPFLGLVLVVLSPLIIPGFMIWGLVRILQMSVNLWSSEAKYDEMVTDAREKLMKSADELELKLSSRPKTTPHKLHFVGNESIIEEFGPNEFRFVSNGEDLGYKFGSLEEAQGFITD